MSENTENDYGANLDHLAPVFENSNLTNLLEQEQLKVIYKKKTIFNQILQ